MIPFPGGLETTCLSYLMQRACKQSPFWHLAMWGSGRAFSMEDGGKTVVTGRGPQRSIMSIWYLWTALGFQLTDLVGS